MTETRTYPIVIAKGRNGSNQVYGIRIHPDHLQRKVKGRSLNPSQSIIWYNTLRHKFWVFNKDRRLDGLPQLSFDQYCKMRGFDLSGKQFIDVTVLP